MIRDPRGGHNRKKVDENFFKNWSPGMAYILGFMFADGSLIDSNSSSRTYYLSFFNNDLALLSQIKRVLQSDHRIYVKPPKLMTINNRKYTSHQGYVLRIGSKNMYQDLLTLGLTHRKSNTMHLPHVPSKYFNFFLRGYFDGDGCVNLSLPMGRSTPRIRLIFTSGSVSFLSELSVRLSKILAIKAPQYYQSMGAHNLMISGAVSCTTLDYMYSNLEKAPYLERKYLKYLNYKNNLMGPRVKKSLGINQALAMSRTVSTRRLE